MARRVEDQEVRDIADDASPSISFATFIDTATALTDYVQSQDTGGILTDALLKEVEKYLAAHFYHHRDQPYLKKKTGDAVGTYQGQFDKRLDSTRWGQTAITLDVTGTLVNLSAGNRRPTLAWLGKPKSAQIDYRDRD